MKQEQISKQPKKRKDEIISDLEAKESESAKEAVEDTNKLLDEIDALMEQDPIAVLQQTLKDKEGKPLTLADLMREGASVTNQAIGTFTTPTGETCALSAAMLAAKARGLAT